MSARRPVIGMLAAVERVKHGPWEEQAAMLPRAYAAAVQRAGGLALMLPPDDRLADDPDEALDLLDGLLLAGGCDIDPSSYGADRDTQLGGTTPDRDRFEIALGARALERDMPLLGVCRGMQMLNVIAGGTLVQHLPDRLGHDRHRHTPGVFADHAVELVDGSLAARATAETRHAVKSHHHQGIDRLGDGLVVSGRAAEDGLPEAIELPGRGFALGVLWHPEEDTRSRVIGALVEEARSRRKASGRVEAAA